MNAQPDDLIEAYLDDLLVALRGTPRDIRHTLAECEAHLRDSAEREIAQGASVEQAARNALAQFGDVATVAAACNRAHRPAAMRALVPSLLLTGARLAGVGFTAIGASGIVSWLLMKLTSTAAVFGAPPGTRYPASACSYWLRLHGTARTCAQAALLEGRDDSLVQRWALGILGIVLLLAVRWWQHRGHEEQDATLRLPAALIAATSFGVAGIGLTGYGIDRAIQNTGAGQWLSAGAVALAVAAGYIVLLARSFIRVGLGTATLDIPAP